ncbi:glycosyltransferase [Candidatus Fermentibacteria bacterium]|nr:glycosyltransferase [Candidatus Fermentibacteria bacterium]
MNYLLTGGGTGGHVYPALAMAEHVRSKDSEARFLYVGVRGRAEAELVPPTGIPLRFVCARGLPAGTSPAALMRFGLTMAAGVGKAMLLLRRWRPDVIVGTGGYVSAPVVMANHLLTRLGISRVPVLLHEQNAVPGRLNRLAGSWATVIASTYPSAAGYFSAGRVLVSGYPVRARITTPLPREDARRDLGIDGHRRVVLVFGGSLGSRSLNRGIVAALPALTANEGILVIHATGRPMGGGYDPVADTNRAVAALAVPPDPARYRRLDYLDPIAVYLSAADLVVSRAGAGTLNELCVMGKAALLVPKANLPGDHQVKNALALQAAGAAEILYERPLRTDGGVVDYLPPDELAARVLDLLADPGRRARVAKKAESLATPNAASRLAHMIVSLARGVLPEAPVPMSAWPTIDGAVEPLTALSASALLARVVSRGKGSVALSIEERAYLQYRTDGYLASSKWEERNWGVKLAGALGHAERADLIASLVVQRRRHPTRWQRWAGLLHEENGFIRRNALTALAGIGVWSEAVRGAIVYAIQDRYFEIRSAGCRLAMGLAAPVRADVEIVAMIRTLTGDPRFEVRAAALAALGEVDKGEAPASLLIGRFLDPNWKVRAAAVDGLRRLANRDALSPQDRTRIEGAIRGLLLTSTGFRPLFELKDSLALLSQALRAHDHA